MEAAREELKREIEAEADETSLRLDPNNEIEETKEKKQLDAEALGMMDTFQTAKSSYRNERIAKLKRDSAEKLKERKPTQEDQSGDEKGEWKVEIVTGNKDGEL